MRFEVEHSFDASPGRLAELLLDLDFQNSLSDISGLSKRQVLLQEEVDGEILRRVRYVLDIQINGTARRFMGAGDPAWVEVARWHPDEMLWVWDVEPEVAHDLLQARGETIIGSTDGGSSRRVIGDIKVKVPLYGGKVEGWIADGLRKAYEEEAVRIAEAL